MLLPKANSSVSGGDSPKKVGAAEDAPASAPISPKPGNWVVKNFRLHTGATLPELNIHYTTLGDEQGEPVLVLHGTGGSGASMLTAAFGGELFGAGQPLDASKYFIILPDALGAGQSSKPSDGLRMQFPQYNYADMVHAQYRLVTERFHIQHLRLVLGYSMGGMHTWLWAENYPDFMDIAVPLAALPIAMSGRNWMLRRLLIESIRSDPEWMQGNYVQQPRSLRLASVFYATATSGGNQGLYKKAPTREKADALLDVRLSTAPSTDANDTLYQYEAASDYDPAAGLGRIRATVLAVNASDDERNPLELGVLEPAIQQLADGRLFIIPGGPDTSGHGTAASAKLWKHALSEVLQTAPRTGK